MCAEDWSWLHTISGELDDDFAQAVNEQPEQQERPALDELFADPSSCWTRARLSARQG
jgi:hypothetical protein